MSRPVADDAATCSVCGQWTQFLDPGYITTTCTDCAVCGIEYRDVDDFIARNPRASGSTPWTPDPDTGFTDELCWEADE